MNANAQPLATAEPVVSADPTVILRETALAVLTNSERFDDFYARVKAEVDAHVPDVTTTKGREAIKSLAFKVVKTKTAIDAAGKVLTEEWRSQTKKVDESRKVIRDKLDALRDEARKPLTDWEAAEEKRVADCEAAFDRFQAATVVAIGETAADVSGRLADIEATELDAKLFGDMLPMAEAAVSHAKAVLQAAVARLAQEEADRAELARLRQQEAERLEREAAERAAAEARAIEERQRQEREEAEARAQAEAEERARREAEEQAERERIAAANAAQAAEDRVRAEERAAAEAAAVAQADATRARLGEETRQREAAQLEAERLRREQADREREADAKRRADEARAADIEHRSTIMRAAKEALMEHAALKEPAAKAVILAIAGGSVPSVSIAF